MATSSSSSFSSPSGLSSSTPGPAPALRPVNVSLVRRARTSCVRETCSRDGLFTLSLLHHSNRGASGVSSFLQHGQYFATPSQQRREKRYRAHTRLRFTGRSVNSRPHCSSNRILSASKTPPLPCSPPIDPPGFTSYSTPASVAESTPQIQTNPVTENEHVGDVLACGSVDILAVLANERLSSANPKFSEPGVQESLPQTHHGRQLSEISIIDHSSPESLPPLMADRSESPLEPALPTPTSVLPELPSFEVLPPRTGPVRTSHPPQTWTPYPYSTSPPASSQLYKPADPTPPAKYGFPTKPPYAHPPAPTLPSIQQLDPSCAPYCQPTLPLDYHASQPTPYGYNQFRQAPTRAPPAEYPGPPPFPVRSMNKVYDSRTVKDAYPAWVPEQHPYAIQPALRPFSYVPHKPPRDLAPFQQPVPDFAPRGPPVAYTYPSWGAQA